MRIAWFTPLSRRSAIGDVALRIAEALSGHAYVEIWTTNVERARATELPIVDFTRSYEQLSELEDYDLCVYHFGDHVGFHGEIFNVARRHPGIVVLHDRVYQNLFAGIWLGNGFHSQYLSRMETFYGDAGRRAAEGSLAGARTPVWESADEALRFPLAEELLAGARGAIVHSESHAEDVRGRWFGPVHPLFLPTPAPRTPASQGRASVARDGRVLVASLGHVNPNRHLHEVVAALSADAELAARVHYVILGPFDPDQPYVQDLQEQIASSGLTETVDLAGYRRDEVRDELLAAADIFVNLRFPALEGASASLIEQLSYGKPVLVYDTGSYAEVPDDAVLKVAPGDVQALRSVFGRVVRDPDLRKNVGEKAVKFAASRTPEAYARGLLELADELPSWEPVLELCDTVAAELGWMGADPRLGAVDAAARELAVLFAEPGDERVDLRDLVSFGEIGPAHTAALVRFFARNDIAEVVGHFDPFPLSEETARRIADATGKDRYYGAFLGDRIVAFSMLRGWDEGFEVPSFGIAVDRDLHGSGIGGRMTEWTIEQARALGAPRVRLSVYGSNRIAHELYRRRGFEEVERSPVERSGVKDERIVMLKEFGQG